MCTPSMLWCKIKPAQKTVLCKNCVKFDPAHHVCISFKYETLNFTHVKCAYRLGNLNCNLILEAEAETCISECFHSFVHSFIHCRHLYSASTSGTTQKCYQPQRPNNVVLSCWRNFWENTLGSDPITYIYIQAKNI